MLERHQMRTRFFGSLGFTVIMGLAVLCGCKSPVTTQGDEKPAPSASKQDGAERTETEGSQTTDGAESPKPDGVAEKQEADAGEHQAAQEAAPSNEASGNGPGEDSASQPGSLEEMMANLKWESDVVDRFDFDYEVPSFMKELPPPDNADGSTYTWQDITFSVWGAHDVYGGENPAKAALSSSIEFLGHEPHYKVSKPNYYIMSDYNKDNNIFYRKCVFKWELEFCEQLSYPEKYKKTVEPIVKKIAAFDVTREPDLDPWI